ncbi:hypothetical protein OHD16_05285 [Sphingobacterium sp. ML3W]|uniref:hypothetical protein n=1 Tax=Sphingobacterium sp. ML3W TaxID=1538644 RepID=UPI00249A16BA|nr:hypothetical protein [Sphingobacterium sp. ML3W]WFA79380.1 hypothetical protein OGI71_25530 [Sphingobacterium sp. ML3W]
MFYIDFLIAVLIANAIPHFIFGIAKIRFLGLFGYSPTGNICYALLQFIIAVSLFSHQYGITNIFTNPAILGGLAVLLLYFVFGRLLINKFHKK